VGGNRALVKAKKKELGLATRGSDGGVSARLKEVGFGQKNLSELRVSRREDHVIKGQA